MTKTTPSKISDEYTEILSRCDDNNELAPSKESIRAESREIVRSMEGVRSAQNELLENWKQHSRIGLMPPAAVQLIREYHTAFWGLSRYFKNLAITAETPQ